MPLPLPHGDSFDAAALFLARDLAQPERTLDQHKPGPNGWCLGCRKAVQSPCTLAAIAQQALTIRRTAR